jgi:hypothetical protein
LIPACSRRSKRPKQSRPPRTSPSAAANPWLCGAYISTGRAPESHVEEKDELGERVDSEHRWRAGQASRARRWRERLRLAPEMDIVFGLPRWICKDAMHFTPAIQIDECNNACSFCKDLDRRYGSGRRCSDSDNV